MPILCTTPAPTTGSATTTRRRCRHLATLRVAVDDGEALRLARRLIKREGVLVTIDENEDHHLGDAGGAVSRRAAADGHHLHQPSRASGAGGRSRVEEYAFLSFLGGAQPVPTDDDMLAESSSDDCGPRRMASVGATSSSAGNGEVVVAAHHHRPDKTGLDAIAAVGAGATEPESWDMARAAFKASRGIERNGPVAGAPGGPAFGRRSRPVCRTAVGADVAAASAQGRLLLNADRGLRRRARR